MPSREIATFIASLFDDETVRPPNGLQFGLLQNAARQQWRAVEPAIFGTLLERALNPAERHELGAHFTPRAYVERLVLPTVIEPLRAEWQHVRTAALTHANGGRLAQAIAEVRAFHHHLCDLRILDPACGSGNFLYVTLALLKDLEGEVTLQLQDFGDRELTFELQHFSVDPHQFLGLEINPRAAAIAELVLWIGYLQWHFKLHGQRTPPVPILRAFKNIECRDAVLACDAVQEVTWQMAQENPDLPGLPDFCRSRRKEAQTFTEGNQSLLTSAPTITVWDRRSLKTDPITGREVPDETQRVPLLAYLNPRPAEWPAADFIVGNPPFLGTARMRADLGDGYAETLRAAYPEVPESADFVLYWWHKAATLVRAGQARRFGFITTNSLRQTFARRVVQFHLEGRSRGDETLTSKEKSQRLLTSSPTKEEGTPLSLVFAIPDHPWVDTADGAAVRIAMTVGVAGEHPGELLEVTDEQPQEDGSEKVEFRAQRGKIQASLTIGADIANAVELKANLEMSFPGVEPHGKGFTLTPSEAEAIGLGKIRGLESHIRPYQNGKDLTDKPRGALVIDLYGLSLEEVRSKYPGVYQHVLTHVKPERDANPRPSRRENWWIFGEPCSRWRRACMGLKKYISTVKTAKHRVFQLLDSEILPDSKLINIASDDCCILGVLSSRIHCSWTLAVGSHLGVGNDPTYVKSASFDKFPFPLCGEPERARIRTLAEALDAHRKRVQAQHPGLTLTGLYNVLEKLCRSRRKEAQTSFPEISETPHVVSYELTPKEKLIHDQGLVSVLQQLHADLDAAVFAAYGWPATLTDAEILERLVALNAARAEEEQRGIIHWLRPEYQDPSPKVQGALDLPAKPAPPKRLKSAIGNRQSAIPQLPWPKSLPERVRAVETALHAAPGPVTPEALAATFLRAQPEAIAEILETLVTLGRARQQGGQFMR